MNPRAYIHNQHYPMEKVVLTETSKTIPKPSKKGNLSATILYSVFTVTIVILAVYLDRVYIAPIDVGCISQCLSGASTSPDQPSSGHVKVRHVDHNTPHNTPHNDHTTHSEATPKHTTEHTVTPLSGTTGPQHHARSTYEITTYDPFIEGIFNGSKTMVFMNGRADHRNKTVCDEVADLRGQVVTLRSSTTVTHAYIPRIVDVYIKDVVRVHLLKAIIGEYSVNCGLCDNSRLSFCEVTKEHEVYDYFMPGLSAVPIIDIISAHFGWRNDYTWSNYVDIQRNMCDAYSVADKHGRYFMFDEYMAVGTGGAFKSHITHRDTPRYVPNSAYRQCFIEIELTR